MTDARCQAAALDAAIMLGIEDPDPVVPCDELGEVDVLTFSLCVGCAEAFDTFVALGKAAIRTREQRRARLVEKRNADVAARHLEALGPAEPQPDGSHCYPAEDLVGLVVGALTVTRYLKPSALSPWWVCVCGRCKVEQAHRGSVLRNRVPLCRACGAAS